MSYFFLSVRQIYPCLVGATERSCQHMKTATNETAANEGKCWGGDKNVGGVRG